MSEEQKGDYLPEEERLIPDWMREDYGELGEDAVQRAYEAYVELHRNNAVRALTPNGQKQRLLRLKMNELYPEFEGSRVPYEERTRRLVEIVREEDSK